MLKPVPCKFKTRKHQHPVPRSMNWRAAQPLHDVAVKRPKARPLELIFRGMLHCCTAARLHSALHPAGTMGCMGCIVSKLWRWYVVIWPTKTPPLEEYGNNYTKIRSKLQASKPCRNHWVRMTTIFQQHGNFERALVALISNNKTNNNNDNHISG